MQGVAGATTICPREGSGRACAHVDAYLGMYACPVCTLHAAANADADCRCTALVPKLRQGGSGHGLGPALTTHGRASLVSRALGTLLTYIHLMHVLTTFVCTYMLPWAAFQQSTAASPDTGNSEGDARGRCLSAGAGARPERLALLIPSRPTARTRRRLPACIGLWAPSDPVGEKEAVAARPHMASRRPLDRRPSHPSDGVARAAFSALRSLGRGDVRPSSSRSSSSCPSRPSHCSRGCSPLLLAPPMELRELIRQSICPPVSPEG